MCNCTYIPRSKKSFILCSNRDETPKRAATQIGILKVENRKVYYPQDKQEGGSWMAIDNEGRAVCLLNGEDEKHQRADNYRRSRGLMVLDYFSFDDHVKFIAEYNFVGIEPFTMILVKQGDLTVLKWDGAKKKVAVLDPHKKYIWSSAMLYDDKQITKRKEWFTNWQKAENFSHESIINFHKSSSEDSNGDGLLINRPSVKTLSVTSIQKLASNSILEHHDLEEEKIKRISVEHQNKKRMA